MIVSGWGGFSCIEEPGEPTTRVVEGGSSISDNRRPRPPENGTDWLVADAGATAAAALARGVVVFVVAFMFMFAGRHSRCAPAPAPNIALFTASARAMVVLDTRRPALRNREGSEEPSTCAAICTRACLAVSAGGGGNEGAAVLDSGRQRRPK